MKDILIIGASRGIGLGLVREALRRGYAVTATRRGEAADLDALGDKANGLLKIETVDTADARSGEALRESLAAQTFDTIVINAGVGGPAANPRTVAHDDFNSLMVTNALGPAQLAELLSKSLKPRTGVMAFMTSQLGSVEQNTNGGMELYRASKAALNSLVRSFAARHAEKGWAVLALHPGWVRTAMGGDQAPVSVADSARGLMDVIEGAASERRSGYLNYRGETLPW